MTSFCWKRVNLPSFDLKHFRSASSVILYSSDALNFQCFNFYRRRLEFFKCYFLFSVLIPVVNGVQLLRGIKMIICFKVFLPRSVYIKQLWSPAVSVNLTASGVLYKDWDIHKEKCWNLIQTEFLCVWYCLSFAFLRQRMTSSVRHPRSREPALHSHSKCCIVSIFGLDYTS